MLAPPEGLRAPGVGVRSQPQRSGGDPKVILAKKNFVTPDTDGQTDVIVKIVK